ncbi:hypothetical protein PR202_gb23416 [Eleusine coracana subsp. coracana]|uniref:Uncharacterized protein n=1 Tax=Eleusine coracana subsp. coracana TaxID=191504 RepID=A0AAV5FK44_ELECO|nr:hypothetical protein PR202_gb23416 [Eleusine coracana subsp. coracana]
MNSHRSKREESRSHGAERESRRERGPERIATFSPATSAARAMASAKLLYIVVVDDGASSFRYTRSLLHSTLQLMGCKPRHAFEISRKVFDVVRGDHHGDMAASSAAAAAGVQRYELAEATPTTSPRQFQFELYKRRTTVLLPRDLFLDLVCDALALYKYVAPNQRADLMLACRIRERKESVTILLCGTSGCGKSTLSTLLGSRLGITTVVSTDSIRHMMRSFVEEKENPLLWASTYHAGECLDPVAVAESKTRRKAKKRSGMSNSSIIDCEESGAPKMGKNDGKTIGKKQMAIEGYKAQSEMVIDSLDRLITAWEDRKESVVVEGCTSQAGNNDESWASATEGSSRHDPSSSGSPKKSDGHCKEIKESSAASGSDEEEEEEADIRPNSGSDEDLSEEDNREIHEEMEGSVDEDCNRSDEEYDDLAMRDSMENGYLTDDGVFYTGSNKSSSIKFLDVNQKSHNTPRKRQENLRTLSSKLDISVPETARSSSGVPASASNKRHATRKWKRSLSDSLIHDHEVLQN